MAHVLSLAYSAWNDNTVSSCIFDWCYYKIWAILWDVWDRHTKDYCIGCFRLGTHAFYWNQKIRGRVPWKLLSNLQKPKTCIHNLCTWGRQAIQLGRSCWRKWKLSPRYISMFNRDVSFQYHMLSLRSDRIELPNNGGYIQKESWSRWKRLQ